MKNIQEFLGVFNHALYTIGTIRHYPTNKQLVRSFPLTPDKLSFPIDTECDWYFTPNESNGVLNPRGTACHADSNITLLQSLFLDIDSKTIHSSQLVHNSDSSDKASHIANVRKFSQITGLKPHLVVNTSPDNYHVYWLIEPLHTSHLPNVSLWKRLQIYLHQNFSCDESAKNLGRLMRLPFTRNTKKNFLVKVIYDNTTSPRYNLNEIEQRINDFESSDKLNTKKLFHVPTHTEKLKSPDEPFTVSAGNRHQTLLRQVQKWVEQNENITKSEVLWLAKGFIETHFNGAKEFLPNGQRFETDTQKIIRDAFNYREINRKKEQDLLLTKTVEIKKTKDPFELDPEFFYQAPGLVGELTRYIVDSSSSPIPSHSFAAAVSLIGLTKCRFIHGHDNLPPADFFLCLAPSASGKSKIKDILMELVRKLGLRPYIHPGISTAQGMITHLEDTPDALALILFDEVQTLFQTIQNKKAATYETKIATELTSLYTAYGSDYQLPRIRTQKGKSKILEHPILSFIGFGHYDLVETLITKHYITTGFIPRFLILNVTEDNPRDDFVKRKPIPKILIEQLEHYVRLSRIGLEEKITENNAKDNNVEPLPPIVSKELPFGIGVEALFKAFRLNMNSAAKDAVTVRNGLEAIFKRGAEHAYRLALAIEDSGQIQPSTMEYCLTLAGSQVNSFYTKFDKILNRSKFSKDTDRLEDKILECLHNVNGTGYIVKRDLQRNTRHWFERPEDFHRQLKQLEEMGVVKIDLIGKKQVIRWTKELE